MARRYVAVEARFDERGHVLPLAVLWSDGRRFAIDRVLEERPACSQTTGEDGVRYRVLIAGRERCIYREGDCWLVDAREPRRW